MEWHPAYETIQGLSTEHLLGLLPNLNGFSLCAEFDFNQDMEFKRHC
jgi:hypothetical protein